ncbi:hypothetical protein OHV05_09300 [Kitasatospora sp. NBC_00070]|uniref:hypothetical protein n=1 Tax=Kitasatospora sp. NBC_00070 TaxID=2975962 RepID=UPI003249D61A
MGRISNLFHSAGGDDSMPGGTEADHRADAEGFRQWAEKHDSEGNTRAAANALRQAGWSDALADKAARESR